MEHVAGFCLSEGIVDDLDDFEHITRCEGSDAYAMNAKITTSRHRKIENNLNKRGYISQTSCGICGKEVIDDIVKVTFPFRNEVKLNIEKAYKCLESLSKYQPLRRITRASHGAAIFGFDFEILSFAEDVGRHNALDKAIGKVFLKKKLSLATLVVLSSRISYELVQKAARARITTIIAVSRPTSLARDLAKKLNMTLACFAKNDGLYIYCGKKRLL